MIKYIKDGDNAGRVITWEIMTVSGISAPALSGLAKGMVPIINGDIDSLRNDRAKRENHGGTRTIEDCPSCDLSRLKVKSAGKRISISYSIVINRFSGRDKEFLSNIGFIDIVGG
jgi:hypothetical protein